MAEQRNPGTDDRSTPAEGSAGGEDAPNGAQPQAAGHSVKSMVGAMGILAVIVLGMAGLMGQCSFSPLGPSVAPGSAPSVNAHVALTDAAKQVEFPVFEPELPASWQANSSDVRQVPSPSGDKPAGTAVRVGWLTAENRYVRLTQSNAPEAALVAFETEQVPRAKGVVQAAGAKWVVYQSIRSEVAWVTQRDGVQLLITGSGSQSAFRTVAKAVMTAPRVDPKG